MTRTFVSQGFLNVKTDAKTTVGIDGRCWWKVFGTKKKHTMLLILHYIIYIV